MRLPSSALIQHVVELLVAGRYQELERLSQSRRLNAGEIEQAVLDYGRTMVMPPGRALEMDVVEVEHQKPPAFAVTVTLWSREEGRSNLSLELTLIEHDEGPVVEIDNLHVL